MITSASANKTISSDHQERRRLRLDRAALPVPAPAAPAPAGPAPAGPAPAGPAPAAPGSATPGPEDPSAVWAPPGPTGPVAWPPVSPDSAVASLRGGGVIVPVPPGISGSAPTAPSPSWPGSSAPGEPVLAGSPILRSSFIGPSLTPV